MKDDRTDKEMIDVNASSTSNEKGAYRRAQHYQGHIIRVNASVVACWSPLLPCRSTSAGRAPHCAQGGLRRSTASKSRGQQCQRYLTCLGTAAAAITTSPHLVLDPLAFLAAMAAHPALRLGRPNRTALMVQAADLRADTLELQASDHLPSILAPTPPRSGPFCSISANL